MKRKNITKLSALLLGACMVVSFTGCGGNEAKKDGSKDVVKISLWTDEKTAPILKEELENFKELHKEEASFEFTVSVEGIGNCKDTVLSNPKGAADLFSFADDQLEDMYQSGVLLEVTEHTDEVLDAIGGADSGIAQTVLRDGKLYAYPETASNGYFLYYNKKYFSEEDVKTLDRILEVCKDNNRKFSMDFSDGWYIYSFFKGAGLDIYSNETGTANICNWNATDTEYTGVDVAKAMLDISAQESFMTLDDIGFTTAVESGVVIAGVNGAWNFEVIEKTWGEDYAAAKLPTYTIRGDQKQMCSFLGYKLMGINANTKHPEWCMKIAEYLTNEENILERCKLTGECPANEKAAADSEIQKSPVVKALAQQAEFGSCQSVADPYWKASSKLGITLAAGNLGNRDLQELLDEAQAAIVAK